MQQACFEAVLPYERIVSLMLRFLLRVASERPGSAVTGLAHSCRCKCFRAKCRDDATGGGGLREKVSSSVVDRNLAAGDCAAVACGYCAYQPQLGRARNRDVCLAHLLSDSVVHREACGKISLRQSSEIAVRPGGPACVKPYGRRKRGDARRFGEVTRGKLGIW